MGFERSVMARCLNVYICPENVELLPGDKPTHVRNMGKLVEVRWGDKPDRLAEEHRQTRLPAGNFDTPR